LYSLPVADRGSSVAKVDGARTFEVRDPVPAVVDQFLSELGAACGRVDKLDNGLDLLAESPASPASVGQHCPAQPVADNGPSDEHRGTADYGRDRRGC
jgi:hypothetical protein